MGDQTTTDPKTDDQTTEEYIVEGTQRVIPPDEVEMDIPIRRSS